MSQEETKITVESLLPHVVQKQKDGLRFITMVCLNAENGFDIIYYFEKSYNIQTLRLHIGEKDELPSITGIYLAAVLIENEIQDFFGIKVSGLAIDLHGKMLLSDSAPKTPMKKNVGMGLETVNASDIKGAKGESK